MTLTCGERLTLGWMTVVCGREALHDGRCECIQPNGTAVRWLATEESVRNDTRAARPVLGAVREHETAIDAARAVYRIVVPGRVPSWGAVDGSSAVQRLSPSERELRDVLKNLHERIGSYLGLNGID